MNELREMCVEKFALEHTSLADRMSLIICRVDSFILSYTERSSL